MSDKGRVASAALFPTDRPLSPDAMIGRKGDVDRIAMALTGGVNVVGFVLLAVMRAMSCKHEPLTSAQIGSS
jgi:hypothetical protein